MTKFSLCIITPRCWEEIRCHLYIFVVCRRNIVIYLWDRELHCLLNQLDIDWKRTNLYRSRRIAKRTSYCVLLGFRSIDSVACAVSLCWSICWMLGHCICRSFRKQKQQCTFLTLLFYILFTLWIAYSSILLQFHSINSLIVLVSAKYQYTNTNVLQSSISIIF